MIHLKNTMIRNEWGYRITVWLLMYMFSVHPLMLDGGSFSDLPLLQKCRWEFSFKAKRCLRWFFSLTSSRSLAEPKHPPFLRPRLIHLPMARTDLQNKQSFGDCSRIVGQMLNRCWLSLLRIQWTESGSIPQSLIYHNMCSHSNAPPLTVKAGDSLLLMYCHVRPSKALRLYLQRWTHPRPTPAYSTWAMWESSQRLSSAEKCCSLVQTFWELTLADT